MSKNPEDIKDFVAMKDLAHYWMQKSYMYYVENQAIKLIMKELGIEVNFGVLLRKMNEISREETEKWEKNNPSRKR